MVLSFCLSFKTEFYNSMEPKCSFSQWPGSVREGDLCKCFINKVGQGIISEDGKWRVTLAEHENGVWTQAARSSGRPGIHAQGPGSPGIHTSVSPFPSCQKRVPFHLGALSLPVRGKTLAGGVGVPPRRDPQVQCYDSLHHELDQMTVTRQHE